MGNWTEVFLYKCWPTGKQKRLTGDGHCQWFTWYDVDHRSNYKKTNLIAPTLLHIGGYNCHMNFDSNTNDLCQCGIWGNEIDFLVKGQHDHLWVEIPTEKGEVLCGCIYRSPSNYIDLASFNRSTDNLLLTHINIIIIVIAGDLNYKNIENGKTNL